LRPGHHYSPCVPERRRRPRESLLLLVVEQYLADSHADDAAYDRLAEIVVIVIAAATDIGISPPIIVRDECLRTSKSPISVRPAPMRSQAVITCGYHAARCSINVVAIYGRVVFTPIERVVAASKLIGLVRA
jgi:hypothetical protein